MFAQNAGDVPFAVDLRKKGVAVSSDPEVISG
jgi:hypothetical protein